MKNLEEYDAFIEAKTKHAKSIGFESMAITAPLFDWQAHVVKWARIGTKGELFQTGLRELGRGEASD